MVIKVKKRKKLIFCWLLWELFDVEISTNKNMIKNRFFESFSLLMFDFSYTEATSTILLSQKSF